MDSSITDHTLFWLVAVILSSSGDHIRTTVSDSN